jgi:hypothetical protein
VSVDLVPFAVRRSLCQLSGVKPDLTIRCAKMRARVSVDLRHSMYRVDCTRLMDNSMGNSAIAYKKGVDCKRR